MLLKTSRPYTALPVYLIAFIAIYALLHACCGLPLPDSESLVRYDAIFFREIRDTGLITYVPGTPCNAGFSPVFSYVWRWLHVTATGISVINFLLFAGALLALAKYLKLSARQVLFYLAIPSAMFFFIPYCEALFFVAGVMLIRGLQKENVPLASLGFFLTGIVKSSALLFIPAIVFLALISSAQKPLKNTLAKGLLYAASSATGLLLVALVQYLQTGVWLAFAKAQVSGWQHSFQWPALPFTTWDNARILWLDGAAFLICMLAFIACLVLLYKRLVHKASGEGPAFLFSCAYLAMVMVYIVFFHSKDGATGTTSIMSANRYVFATPFFPVFFYRFRAHLLVSRYKYAIGALLLLGCLWLFGITLSHWWLQKIGTAEALKYGYFVLLFFYFAAYIYHAEILEKPLIFAFWILLNITLQALCFGYYNQDYWIG